MPFNPDQYLAEKTGSAFNPDQYLAEKNKPPEQPGILQKALGAVSNIADRLGPAEIRGAAQGIQDYQPDGNGSFHPGVLGAMAKGAWDGLIHPDAVQSAQTQFARMGLPNQDSQKQVMTPGFIMKTHAASSEYGLKPEDAAKYENGKMYPLTVDYSSPAKVAGMVQDAISPAPLGGMLVKGLGKAAGITSDAMKLGATKAILSGYPPSKLAAYAQKIGTFGDEGDAVQAVANKLKENDLLYAPGKANFNLKKAQSDIGSQIGETVQAAKQKGVVVNPQNVINQYSALKDAMLAESGKGVGTYRDFAKDVLPEIQGMIDDLKPNELGQVPVDKGVSFRQALQGMVKKWDNTKNSPLVQQVAKDLQSSMNQEILKSDDVLGPKLAGLNQKYSDLMNAESLINPAYKKALGNTIAGKQGTALQGIAAVIKHPIESAGSPMQSLMKLNPRKAEQIANAGNIPAGVDIPQIPARPATPLNASQLPSIKPGIEARALSAKDRLSMQMRAHIAAMNDFRSGVN